MSFWDDTNVLVTGGAGFLGSFVIDKLRSRSVPASRLRVPRSRDLDLRQWDNCVKAVEGIDIVIHLAGRVGGIGFNRKYPATLFYDNAMMGLQLMEAARLAGVRKYVAAGTVCAYPKFTRVPFREDHLWDGYPEETNAPYGIAKKIQLVQGQSYRQQYGFSVIFLLPVNLYGVGDNFHLEHSHVIPALIRKLSEAKHEGRQEVAVWGTGKASREFLYVEDAAEGILLAAERYDKPEPVNLGSGMEITIYDLVHLVAELVGFKGAIVWDSDKPDGQPRRCLDVGRAESEFGFKASTDFRQGLKKTIDWFEANREAILGYLPQ